MDQIVANTLKMLPNMQADTVKTAIKKLTDTPQKHVHYFQRQSEFKCKKVPNISDLNKQRN